MLAGSDSERSRTGDRERGLRGAIAGDTWPSIPPSTLPGHVRAIAGPGIGQRSEEGKPRGSTPVRRACPFDIE
jgi:hypothetical protein